MSHTAIPIRVSPRPLRALAAEFRDHLADALANEVFWTIAVIATLAVAAVVTRAVNSL